jgi:protein-L-isoaspartate O-methyltransferase
MMAVASNSADERLKRIFELVPREAFLGPGPWQIKVNRRYVETPRLTRDRAPDETAVAIYKDLWFSTADGQSF